MSATMNGNPIWCRPAPTRTGAIWDAEDEPLEGVSLAEMPALVAAAIKAGLIKMPGAEEEAYGYKDGYKKDACRLCTKRFWKPPYSRIRVCIPCRFPKRPCEYCKVEFQPHSAHYKTCSRSCAQKHKQLYAQAKNARYKAERTQVPCAICCAMFGMKFTGGKPSQACSQVCGIELFKRNGAAKRAQREANRQNKTNKTNNTQNL